MAEEQSTVWPGHISHLLLRLDAYLDCFCLSTPVRHEAVNVCVQTFT